MSGDNEEFITILNLSAKAGYLDVVGTLLNSLLPGLGSKHIDDAIVVFGSRVVYDENPAMERLFMDSIDLTGEPSFSYLSTRLKSNALNRENMDYFTSMLGSTYGMAMHHAIYCADIEVCRSLMLHIDSNDVGALSDKGGYKPIFSPMKNKSREDIIEVIDIATRAGLINNSDANSSFSHKLFGDRAFLNMTPWNESPSSTIPAIRNSAIENPELMLAFIEEMSKNPNLSNLYSKIPVLISKSELSMYPEARPYLKNHAIHYQGDQSKKLDRPASGIMEYDMTLRCLDSFSSMYSGLNDDMREAAIRHSSDYEISIRSIDENDPRMRDETAAEKVIIKNIAPDIYQLGINDDDMVLCVIKTELLSELGTRAINNESLEVARKDAHNFLSPETISALLMPDRPYEGVYPKVGIVAVGMNDPAILRFMLSSEDRAELIRENISKDLICGLSSSAWQSMTASQHAFMQKEYGVTSSDLGVDMFVVDRRFLDELYSCGYDMSLNENIIFGIDALRSDEDHRKIVSMGGWSEPGEERPKNARAALDLAVGEWVHQVIIGYILNEGVEVMCGAAKKESHWHKLRELFPDDGHTISQFAPASVKRAIIMSDLEI